MNIKQVKKLEFFDCEASFGITGFKRENTPVTKEEMLSKFDRYGIDYALMRYECCSTGIARIGNIELIDEICDNPRLFPMWAVLPHHTGEFPKPEELVLLMKQYNVRIVTLPAVHYWTVGEWTCGELFKTLEMHKIPIFLPLSRMNNKYVGLYEILKVFTRFWRSSQIYTYVHLHIRHSQVLKIRWKNLVQKGLFLVAVCRHFPELHL